MGISKGIVTRDQFVKKVCLMQREVRITNLFLRLEFPWKSTWVRILINTENPPSIFGNFLKIDFQEFLARKLITMNHFIAETVQEENSTQPQRLQILKIAIISSLSMLA